MKVICFLFDPNIGGPTIRVRNVYEQLANQGYAVRVAFPRDEGSAAGFISAGGIAVDRLPIAKPVLPRRLFAFVRFAVSAPLALIRLCHYLRRERPDVIHVNGAFDVLPALAGKLVGVPVVWHLNDTVFGKRLSGLLSQIVRRIATVVVVAAAKVGEHYGVENDAAQVLFAPVDTKRFPARALGTRPAVPAVLTLVGNWNWIKGHEKFIDVLAELRNRGVPVKGLAIGRFLKNQESYWRPLIDRVKSESLSESLSAPGFVEDTPSALASSDLFLLTSHSEACPISVLEAMSVGVPVIAFDVGGVRELVGEGNSAAGIVVPPGDVMTMATAVETLLTNQDVYSHMARNGQDRARSLFSLEACVERHREVYAHAVNIGLEQA